MKNKKNAFTLAESSTHAALSQTKVKSAFTLSEVLITLGIIGVVAALTIPNLIYDYKAKQLRSKFFRTYSVIQQVFKDMEAEGDSGDPFTYPSATFYKTFGQYLTGATDCKNKSAKENCYKHSNQGEKKYRTFSGATFDGSDGYFDEGQLLLQDGTLLLFEQWNGGENDYHCFIAADLNGINNPPNIFGYDVFVFQFLDGEIVPIGYKNTGFINNPLTDLSKLCNKESNANLNGWGCAQLAATDSEYFKKVVRMKF